jgi:hypothetical protein
MIRLFDHVPKPSRSRALAKRFLHRSQVTAQGLQIGTDLQFSANFQAICQMGDMVLKQSELSRDLFGCGFGQGAWLCLREKLAVLTIGRQAKAAVVPRDTFSNKGNTDLQRGLHLFGEQARRVQIAGEIRAFNKG